MNEHTKRIWIRVSESDETIFREKAKGYSSISAMLRQAVRLLDNESATRQFELRKKLIELYKRQDRNLSLIGSNLNQAVRTINEFAKAGLLTDSLVRDLLPSRLTAVATSVAMLQQELRGLCKDVTQIQR